MITKLKAAKTIMLLAAIYNIFWGIINDGASLFTQPVIASLDHPLFAARKEGLSIFHFLLNRFTSRQSALQLSRLIFALHYIAIALYLNRQH